MNFGQALEALKQGKAIRRSGWNDTGMLIYLNKGSVDWKEDINGHLIEGIHESLFDTGAEGTVTRLPNINMQSAQGNTVTGWLASQTDMLAEDWEIVEPTTAEDGPGGTNPPSDKPTGEKP
jgi:hypothetical protein